MRIGLMSDTHMPVDAQELPTQLKDVFRDVDLILHTGDVYAASVLEEVGAIAPLLVSKGDDDYGEVLADERMKEKHILTFEGITIWLFHEFTRELWMDNSGNWKKPLHETRKDPDVVVFGHTHRAALDNRGSVLTVNPGSTTFPNYRRQPGTVGLLELRSGTVEARIIQLHDV
jgi:putative phosphoesterase